MKIDAKFINEDKITLRMRELPKELTPIIADKLKTIADKLVSRIQSTKLSGQKLNRRTGNLYASLHSAIDISDSTKVVATAASLQSSLSTPFHYGAYHEYGGDSGGVSVKSHLRTIKKTGKQFSVSGHFRALPDRSFMRSTLSEMRDEIISDMQKMFDNKG